MGFFDRIARSGRDAAGTGGDGAPQSPCERALIASLAERPADEVVRVALRFTGLVQGVGFRWTNQALARERGLTGWVRNEPDGSVRMELQGPAGAVCAHFGRVHASYRRFGDGICLAEAREADPVPDATDFDVRF